MLTVFKILPCLQYNILNPVPYILFQCKYHDVSHVAATSKINCYRNHFSPLLYPNLEFCKRLSRPKYFRNVFKGEQIKVLIGKKSKHNR